MAKGCRKGRKHARAACRFVPGAPVAAGADFLEEIGSEFLKIPAVCR
jgi:hypothetical protein